MLVAAHGNSLRALVKHLDGISDDEITGLNIPTGQPLVYELGDDFRPVEAKPIDERYLADPAEIAAARQGRRRPGQGPTRTDSKAEPGDSEGRGVGGRRPAGDSSQAAAGAGD